MNNVPGKGEKMENVGNGRIGEMVMYKDPGKLIKRCVQHTNNFGYFISDLLGAFVGIWFGIWMSATTDVVLAWVIGGIAVAGATAAVGCLIVWLLGLLVYAYGDIAENVQKLNNTTE